MKIRKLEISGFKSFPEKTSLEFKSGITSIVGPNGCGKSNIFEALRWVMGEQRVRSLRSKKMEDVIFNGSEVRKPVGLAEVRLTLSNTDGLGPSSMSEYDEIMISRRLFRDGESRYEINNIPCRLSDITDFFLDTGVGRNSYAIIEQGRVDMVVASRPEDRRVLIEEAAGINRYKARREAAVRKLEQTKQNLLRISDVVGEVKRQSASLKRQAAKAERYRKLSEQLRSLDLALQSFRLAARSQELEKTTDELGCAKSELAQRESSFAAAQAALEQERLKALETEKALKEKLEGKHRTDIELTSLRARLHQNRDRSRSLTEFLERAAGDRTGLEAEVSDARERTRTLEATDQETRTRLDSARAELQALQQTVRKAEESLKQNEKLLEDLKDDIFRTLQDSAHAKNTRESLLKRAQQIDVESEKIDRETEQLERESTERETEHQKIRAELERLEQSHSECSAALEELRARRTELRTTVSALQRETHETEREHAALTARRQSLEEFLENYGAYDDCVQFLMQDAGSQGENGLLGPLAELVDVPPEYQKALTGALGERLSHLVVSSIADGVDAAHRLAGAGAGRTTFIPARPRANSDGAARSHPDRLQPLLELVRVREGFERLAEFLLGSFFVVDDLGAAAEIWERNGVPADLVTRDGELVTRHGEITGGSREHIRDEPFEKRREIERVDNRISDVETRLTHTRERLSAETKEIEAVDAAIEEAERAIREFDLSRTELAKDRERLEDAVKETGKRREVLGLESERLAGEKRSLTEPTTRAEEMIERLSLRKLELERRREETGVALDDLRSEVGMTSEEVANLRITIAQMEERSRSLRTELERAVNESRRLEQRLKQLTTDVETAEQELNRISEQTRDDEINERELMTRHESLAAEAARLQTEADSLSRSVADSEESARREERSVKELRETVHSLEMESVRLEQAVEGLVEKVIDRYHVDPRTLDPPDESPDEAEIADIRAKLESIGEVNLAAIAEHTRLEERLAFLLEQEADLTRAVASLYETINKINKTTEERFTDAFRRINEKFEEIFPFLFNGGEARLELTDENDAQGTGVEILARPPGKKIRNMDLLSGGEKALAAVALIFSIFLTRPSPFCLLDEVDAPLDEANVGRFNQMLRRLADKTQFLTITHNKKSMAAADTLYGVTMEEPGISSVVSVEFIE